MIWLVGNKGMLGSEVAAALTEAGFEFVGSDRDVDILDPAAIAAFAAGKGVAWIVNCAAYTAVDRAEDEAELATRLNADGPENLARLAAAIGARLPHGTEFCFLVKFGASAPMNRLPRLPAWHTTFAQDNWAIRLPTHDKTGS